MRITLKTTSNTSIVPFDYQQKVIGTIHKWLGNNEIHDKISLYSFSRLLNKKLVEDKGFNFPVGATLTISFYENQYLKVLIDTILSDPEMFCGIRVRNITIEEQPVFRETPQVFGLQSPIFIKRTIEGNNRFYFYNNEESNTLMTETLKHKMQIAGLPEDKNLKIEFDLSYPRKQIKMVTIHGIKNKANMCPIIIHGSAMSKLFAWTVGVGNSTGSGFGALM